MPDPRLPLRDPPLMKPSRPRILFLINSMGGGGAERVMSRLLGLSQPQAQVYDIHLAILDRGLEAYPIPSWVTVHRLDCCGSFLPSIRQVVSLVRRVRPALRLSFLTRANVANCFASAVSGSPCILSERVNTAVHLDGKRKAELSRMVVRLTYPRSHAIIAVSQGVADGLVAHFGVRPDRIEIVENPVDLDAIRRDASQANPLMIDEPYIFAMGRLTGSKNFAMLLRAFAIADLPAKLVIAGEGAEQRALADLANSLGIANRVEMPGFLANPYATMGRARVFALTSNVEGFPNALVEALALGVPVVATNCPDGPAEILAGKSRAKINGLSEAPAGILSPMKDAELFAKGLRMAFEGPARDRIIAGANHRAGDFSPEDAVGRYWQVIERLLPAPVRSARAG